MEQFTVNIFDQADVSTFLLKIMLYSWMGSVMRLFSFCMSRGGYLSFDPLLIDGLVWVIVLSLTGQMGRIEKSS